MSQRGYCGIGIVGPKTAANVGTLWRSAANLGASFIFTVGHRYPKSAGDTIKAWRHIPMFEVDGMDDLPVPRDCEFIGIEIDPKARDLPSFHHPERAVYLLGAEDSGLPADAISRCARFVEIPSHRCLNVAVAGSLVLYDRMAKAVS
jgi:tRNA G18 (ribose-2'-O)-methylase SpoU